MKRGIVVATCDAHARTWLPDCLRSLAPLPVMLAWNRPPDRNAYDTAALLLGYEAGLDEFWVLPDTTVCKDPGRLWALLHEDGRSFTAGPRFLSCIGKVRRAAIDAMGGPPPSPQSKRAAVDTELGWFGQYAAFDGAQVIDAGFMDGPVREERHGRLNMVIEGSILTKFKATWNDNMIVEV